MIVGEALSGKDSDNIYQCVSPANGIGSSTLRDANHTCSILVRDAQRFLRIPAR
jgi:hypothetical protein